MGEKYRKSQEPWHANILTPFVLPVGHMKDLLSSRVTEIRHSQKAHFLNERLSREFKLILSLFEEIFQDKRLKLHNTSNAQRLSPFTLV